MAASFFFTITKVRRRSLASWHRFKKRAKIKSRVLPFASSPLFLSLFGLGDDAIFITLASGRPSGKRRRHLPWRRRDDHASPTCSVERRHSQLTDSDYVEPLPQLWFDRKKKSWLQKCIRALKKTPKMFAMASKLDPGTLGKKPYLIYILNLRLNLYGFDNYLYFLIKHPQLSFDYCGCKNNVFLQFNKALTPSNSTFLKYR